MATTFSPNRSCGWARSLRLVDSLVPRLFLTASASHGAAGVTDSRADRNSDLSWPSVRIAFLHQAPELAHTSEQPALNGMHADAGDGCNLVQRQIEVPAKNEHQAFVQIQPSQCPAKLDSAQARVWGGFDRAVRLRPFQYRPPARAPDSPALIRDDAKKPRSEFVALSQLAQPAPGLESGLLHRVLCRLTIVQHSAGQPVAWLQRRFKEAHECHLVALLGGLDERHRHSQNSHS